MPGCGISETFYTPRTYVPALLVEVGFEDGDVGGSIVCRALVG